MKTVGWLFTLFTFLSFVANGQADEKDKIMSDIIYRKMESVLEKAGVLVSVSEEGNLKKWKKQANQKMRSSFRQQFVPLEESYSLKSYKHYLRDWDITYLASTYFPTDKFAAPAELQKPTLPIVNNNKQFRITSAGKFNLFYSMTEFTNMAVNVDVEGDAAGFVHASLKSGLKYAKEDKKTFNISSGLFDNELMRIFDDARSNTLESQAEFYPLYLLWQIYANGIMDSTKKFYAIRNMKAVVWNRSESSNFTSHTDIEAALKAESPTLPFLKAKMNSSGTWGNEKEKRTDFSIYDLYIMDEPIMGEILTYKQINRTWNTLSDSYNADYGIVLSPSGSNTIELTFGPITDPIQYSLIKIDTKNFLKQFEPTAQQKKNNPKLVPLISNVRIVGTPQPDQNNSIKLTVDFTYNPAYFTAVSQDLFSEIKTLQINLGDPIGKFRLSKDYHITFNADAKMVPEISVDQNLDPSAKLTDGIYSWKFNVDYKYLPTAGTEILPIEILRERITFSHTQNKVLTGPGYLLKSCCTKDLTTQNRFNCEVILKDPKNLLSASEDFLSGELTLTAITREKNMSLNTPYTRKLPVTLRGIIPPTQITNDLVSMDTPDQIAQFFKPERTVAGKLYANILKENIDENSKIDYVKIGGLLMQTYNFSRDGVSGKYLIPSEFIDSKNYLAFQKAPKSN